jgi:hypothetical protein
MKIRNGFVSNSSSSSFICITAGKEEIYADYDLDDCHFELDCIGLKIDNLIEKLKKAQENGEEKVYIQYGGGYDG